MHLQNHINNGRDNNFNLIRFIAASLVVFSHSYSVTGHAEHEPLSTIFPQELAFGSLAVNLFFILSGFLITKSWLDRGDLIAFLYARVIRIYPALIVSVLFCAFFIGPIYTNLSLIDYFTDLSFLKFIAENSTLLIKGVWMHLPGVFEDNISSSNVNAPLWTLPYELKMYLTIAIIGIIGLFRYKIVILLITVLVMIVYIYLDYLSPTTPTEIYRLPAFFLAGTCFYLYRHTIVLKRQYFFTFLTCSLFVYIFSKTATLYLIYFSLPYLLLYLAYVPKGFIRKFNNAGDYSYGIYIYAFPIQQSLSSYNLIDSPYIMFSISLFLTLLLAIPSWHLIERRVLKASRHKHYIHHVRNHIANNTFGEFNLVKKHRD